MKAIVSHEYGSPDVLRLEEVEKPVPADDEALVEIHAASAHAGDWHLLRADPFFLRLMGFGVFKPKNEILGADFAGRVEAVGTSVKELQPGDEVFGATTLGQKLGVYGGAFAEYVCVTGDQVAPKPPNLSFEEAAAVPSSALAALQALRDAGQVRQGQRVLVNGASGGVGTFAVQIAKAFGAEVTGVCSTKNVDMVRSIGADLVIDYTRDDFTRLGQRYDLIVDTAAYRSILEPMRALSPEGTYLLVGGTTARFLQAALLGPWISRVGMRKIVAFSVEENKKDLLFVKKLIETGQVVPVIDRRYPLGEVPEALRYLEEGHTRGKVVITV
ncbi:MAG: NAD(P)-dependent alcohol dehydrogenase [Polyangiales bacterium]